jgi:hypothetical protein
MFTLNSANLEALGTALSKQTDVTDREWNAIIQQAKTLMALGQTQISSLVLPNVLTVNFVQNDPLTITLTRL